MPANDFAEVSASGRQWIAIRGSDAMSPVSTSPRFDVIKLSSILSTQ
jgi:hypothetical protein